MVDEEEGKIPNQTRYIHFVFVLRILRKESIKNESLEAAENGERKKK
jgi:hypothetical protein